MDKIDKIKEYVANIGRHGQNWTIWTKLDIGPYGNWTLWT